MPDRVTIRILTSVIIPNRRSDGRPVSRRTVAVLRERLIGIGGGYSVQPIRGGWMHEGRLYSDSSVRYEVWLRSWRDVPAFLEIVDWARQALEQITMGIVIAGIPEEI
jgi:hypothetical protein